MVDYDSELIGMAVAAHAAAHELGPEYVSFLQGAENGVYSSGSWSSSIDMEVDSIEARHAATCLGPAMTREVDITERTSDFHD